MINFKVRAKNILFWVSVVVAVLTPVLAYFGITMQEITTWQALVDVLFQAVSNPYVVVLMLVSLYNAILDPTTKGIADSPRAMGYERPSGE